MLERPQSASDDAAPPVGAHESQTQNESRILKVGTCKNTHMCEEMPPEPKLSPFTTVLRLNVGFKRHHDGKIGRPCKLMQPIRQNIMRFP